MNDITTANAANDDSSGDSSPLNAKLPGGMASDHQQMETRASLVKAQAQRIISKVPLLGAVSWLMMQQSSTRYTLLSELEWRVMPALVLDQAKLYMRDGAPVAYVSWARLSEESAQRYRQIPHHLTSADWQSGEQVWLVDLLAPFGGAQQILDDLKNTVLSGQELHTLHMAAQATAP